MYGLHSLVCDSNAFVGSDLNSTFSFGRDACFYVCRCHRLGHNWCDIKTEGFDIPKLGQSIRCICAVFCRVDGEKVEGRLG